MANSRPASAEEFVNFRTVGDPQITPDGELIAFTLSEPFVHDTPMPVSSVWLVPTDGGRPRRATSGSGSENTPRWSPDGQTLAFLSDRERPGYSQIYLMPRTFGEAVRLTDLEGQIFTHRRGTNPMVWSADGTKIAFLMDDLDAHGDKRRGRNSEDPVEFEKAPAYMRLYTIEVSTGAVECVSPDGLQVWEFAWSRDDQRFAAAATDLPFESDWYECRLVVFESGGQATTLYDEERAVSALVWSPDGNHIAFTSSHWSDKYAQRGGVFVVPSGGGPFRELTEGHKASYGWARWSESGEKLLIAGSQGSGYGIAEVDVATVDHKVLWTGPCTFGDASYPVLTMDRSGNLALVKEDSDHPRDVWLAMPRDGGYELKQVTSMHPQTSELELHPTEELIWKGVDGWDIQGFLVRPSNAPISGPLPMITVIHGGPSGAHQNSFAPAMPTNQAQAFAALGYAVFMPNPRGSNGWGLEFTESNLGDQGGKDWQDIMLGVDYCIEKGIADPERLGVTGNSYGGYMTMWAVTQTDRFKAAVTGMSISEWRSFHGVTEIQNWNKIYYAHADPHELDGKYRTFAPLAHVHNVKTPTLILHGEVDLVCPVDQAYQYYRALKELDVDVELCVYPREPHGWKEREHMRDIATRTMEWLTSRV